MPPTSLFLDYAARLTHSINMADWSGVSKLADMLDRARRERRQVFLCGNGGSAANAVHWANDLTAALFKGTRDALRTHALPANIAVMSCLANDLSYEVAFSQQLRVLGEPGDLLIVLSGSGNSPNILSALREAKVLGIQSVAVLGFDGGAALALADHPVHFPVHDMQIVEDLQLVVGHMLMRQLAAMHTPVTI
ncbi:MAG: SIS domain-containing protein [Verrucomicrobia bacterium]|nr:SIS domain-containing protein [Verrucomicrobiota bacterium]